MMIVYDHSACQTAALDPTKGAFVWDQSGIRIIGIMQVNVCLGAILIPEYLDSILAILLLGAE